MSNIDGYPQPYAGVIEAMGTHAGPASYTQVTPGSPPTGGDTLQASELGLKFFDSVEVQGTDATGEYTALPIFSGTNIDLQPTSVKLVWITVAGGAEVAGATNLSAKTLRIRATGH